MQKQEKKEGKLKAERLNIQRIKIAEEQVPVGKLLLWDIACKVLKIPQLDTDNGNNKANQCMNTTKRNQTIYQMNLILKTQRALWRWMTEKNMGIRRIGKSDIATYEIVSGLKHILGVCSCREDRMKALTETLELLEIDRKRAEKAGTLLSLVVDMIEHDINKSKLLNPYKEDICNDEDNND